MEIKFELSRENKKCRCLCGGREDFKILNLVYGRKGKLGDYRK